MEKPKQKFSLAAFISTKLEHGQDSDNDEFEAFGDMAKPSVHC
ncbi:hypothetical protein SynA18461_02456 [Synechococcus sp. A18-46.1]|nr:hypothetical protein SynA18461_02456 [Synechococcus sp. A18-46.1]